jgi:hypothetical protein
MVDFVGRYTLAVWQDELEAAGPVGVEPHRTGGISSRVGTISGSGRRNRSSESRNPTAVTGDT